MPMRHENGPVDDDVHEDEDVNHSVEQAEVEALSRVSRLLRRRHESENDGFHAAIVLINVGVVKVGESPRLHIWESETSHEGRNSTECPWERLTKTMR